MRQIKASGRASQSYPYRTPQCHFCKTVMRKGEEDLFISGSSAGSVHMHRLCLENFLLEHPPFTDASRPPSVTSAKELEQEFEALREQLAKAHLPVPKTARKPRPKRQNA